jgi:hypothetical protein
MRRCWRQRVRLLLHCQRGCSPETREVPRACPSPRGSWDSRVFLSSTSSVSPIDITTPSAGRSVLMAEREGFEPSGPVSQAAFLAGMWFKPYSPTSPSKAILVNLGHGEKSSKTCPTNQRYTHFNIQEGNPCVQFVLL